MLSAMLDLKKGLDRLKAETGRTRAELAKGAFGVHPVTLSHWQGSNGEIGPSIGQLDQAATALGLDLEEVVKWMTARQ